MAYRPGLSIPPEYTLLDVQGLTEGRQKERDATVLEQRLLPTFYDHPTEGYPTVPVRTEAVA